MLESAATPDQVSRAASRRSPYGVLAAAVFVVLAVLFVFGAAEVLLLSFIAVLIGLYLAAITDFLQRRARIPRHLGITIALLATTASVVGIGWLIVPPVLEQTTALFAAAPSLIAGWEAQLAELRTRNPVLGGLIRFPRGGLAEVAREQIGEYFAGLVPYLVDALHIFIEGAAVLVMGLYLALRPGVYREGVVQLTPPVHRDLARDLLRDLGRTLRAWIVGQLVAMTILGGLTWVGLWALGVPYSLAFGVFTGAVAIVPFFGTLVSTLLPALFVLGSGEPVQAFLVVLLGVVVHVFEANVVAPMIMERQVHLPPVLSILSVLIMADLLGVVGLVVAVPTLATLMVIVRRLYVHRVLEGRGFRRAMRDAPLTIRVPDGLGWVHPDTARVSVPTMLEAESGFAPGEPAPFGAVPTTPKPAAAD